MDPNEDGQNEVIDRRDGKKHSKPLLAKADDASHASQE